MKKQVSAILAAGMAASLLVGCGGGSTSAAPAESTSTAASTEAAAPAEATQVTFQEETAAWVPLAILAGSTILLVLAGCLSRKERVGI